MYGTKVLKTGNAEPDEFEGLIGQSLQELEANSDLKQALRDLYITRAKEVDFGSKRVSLVTSF